MTTYRVLQGLNYRPKGQAEEVRAEPGDLVDDLPEGSVKWLLPGGYIEEAREKKPQTKAAATRDVHKAADEADQPSEIPERLEQIREGVEG